MFEDAACRVFVVILWLLSGADKIVWPADGMRVLHRLGWSEATPWVIRIVGLLEITLCVGWSLTS